METRIFLRHLEVTDSGRVHKWHNDPELFSTLFSPFHPVSVQTVEEWIRKRTQYSEKEINFAICLKSNSQHIGNTYIRDIDWVNRCGIIQMFIGDVEHRNKGYGKQALRLMVDYAFLTLGLNRIGGQLFASNVASLKICQNVGYREEGKLRQRVYQDGQFHDALIIGVCRDDWEKMRPK